MTKSIKRLTSSCNGIFFIYVILACTSATLSTPPPCGLYGAPPCQFLPAPPGQTPSCARPGKTYCEHVDNYPTYLIKSLVRKWGYEATHLLVDETWEDFAAVAWHDTPVFYDPKSIFPQRDYNNPNGQDFNGYSYQTPYGGGGPPRGASAGASGSAGAGSSNSLFITNPTTELPTYLLYTSAGQRLNFNKQQPPTQAGGGHGHGHLYYNSGGKSTPYNATLWLKRLVRDLSQKHTMQQQQTGDSKKAAEQQQQQEEKEKKEEKQQQQKDEKLKQEKIGKEEEQAKAQQAEQSKRDVSLNMDLLDIVGVADADAARTTRAKRQSPGRSTLCQTTSQFITPQAALNSRGNWMFVVNEQNTARQMVKAELCASNTCSNLCELPNGYNSRCEQKFVQKRLIALQGNGQNLYTDTFWFPSCCVCTIAAN